MKMINHSIVLIIFSTIFIQSSISSSAPDLTFVVDVSDTVLPYVKEQVSQFFSGWNQEDKNQSRKYNLVTFNVDGTNSYSERDVKLINEKLSSITAINIRRGTNQLCAEKSLTGITKGLNSTSPKSVLFVFTDALPNDKDELSSIQETIAATHFKVIFILIEGKCKDPQSNEYQDIASTSNGQIFKIMEAEVSSIAKILTSLKPLIEPQRVDLLAVDEESKSVQNSSFKIPMSEDFSDLLIAISANSSFTVNVTGPMNEKTPCQVSGHWATCNIEKPMTGNYTINLSNVTSKYSLRASARTNLTFHYGFQFFDKKTSSEAKEVFSLPVKGANNTFIVKFDDPSKIKTMSSVQIISTNGMEKSESYKLTPALNNTVKNNQTYGVYYTFFKFSESKGHVQIIGLNSNNEEFQLITPVAFYPSSEDKNSNPIVKDLNYTAWDKLTNEKNSSSSAPWNCSSLFMISLALLTIFVKTVMNN